MWSFSKRRQERRPILLKFRSNETFIITSICIAVFTEIFLYGIIVPVMPFALTERVGVATDELQQWTAVLLAIYSAFVVIFSPPAGWVADKTTTRRGPLLLSLITFAGATLLLMLGRTLGALIAGRALQGLSAAAVWSIGLALLVDTVGVEKIGEYMGLISLATSLGIFLGPLLGGVVYAKGGYYAVYYMALGVIALDVVLRLMLVEKRVAKRWLGDESSAYRERACNPDPENNFEPEANSAPAGGVVESKQQFESSGAGPHETRSASAGSAASEQVASTTPQVEATHMAELSPELGTEKQQQNGVKSATKQAPVAITLLSSGRLLIAMFGTSIASMIMSAFDTILPLRVADLFGWNSVGAGLIFLAVILPTALGVFVGKLVDRFGSRLIATSAFVILCPALICLRLVDHNSIDQKVLLCALLALCGGSSTLLLVPTLAEITHCVETMQNEHPEKFGGKSAYAQGYGMFNASYALGTLIGPLLSGFIVQNEGWGTATWVLGLFAGVAIIPIFLFNAGWIGKRGWKAELLRPMRNMTMKTEDATSLQEREARLQATEA